MPSGIKRRTKRIVFILYVPLIIISAVLTYFQLFYKSPEVDFGVAKLERTFINHKNIVTAVRFTPDDSLVVSGSVDSTIKIWKRESGEIVREIRHPEAISYLDLSNDGKFIATASYDSKIRIWNVRDGSRVKEFMGHTGTIWAVAFSPDGKKIVSGGDDASVRIWDVATGNLLLNLKGHDRIVWAVRFSPDGSKIASSSFDYSFKIWNVDDGKLIWNNKDHTETVVDIAFSNNGKLLASTSDDKTIRIWNIEEHKLIRTMHVAEHVQAVAFSPDDKRLLTGGRDKPVIGEFLQNIFGDSKYNPGISSRLWDIESGVLLQTFSRHNNDVMDLAYSHDGKWIASASADHTVELWRIEK